jgi:hypothetical protein
MTEGCEARVHFAQGSSMNVEDPCWIERGIR